MNYLRYLIFFMFLSTGALTARSKYALVIGIGDYPANSGWNKIHGDNDIKIIADALVKNGFEPGNIITLKNSEAIKSNIISSIKRITTKAQIGDCVFIHFSGHGQQATDLNGDENDDLDEAIIPYDAQKYYSKGVYQGENHIIDDELNELLTSLRAKVGKEGTILTLIDACHSGDVTRGLELEGAEQTELVIRGTAENFVIPKLINNKPRTNNTKMKNLKWVVISASMPYQNNYEYKKDAIYYGSLSYAFVLAMGDLKQGITFNELFKVIQQKRKEINVSNFPQDPTIEGELMDRNSNIFVKYGR